MYELIDDKKLVLSDPLREFGDLMPLFRKAGVNLYGYAYHPEGEWMLSDEVLASLDHDAEEIRCFRLTETDDFHDPAKLRADLERCLEILPATSISAGRKRKAKEEIREMIAACEKSAASGRLVQICDDMDDHFDDEDDEDE